jgi:hypothetical protein
LPTTAQVRINTAIHCADSIRILARRLHLLRAMAVTIGTEGTSRRLTVAFGSAHTLIGEYAKCVTQGGCVVVSDRAAAVGERLVFELVGPEPSTALEVEGTITHVTPARDAAGAPCFELGVAYRETRRGEVLEPLLTQIAVDSSFDVPRRHPRIPVSLAARDRDRGAPIVVADLSRGGMQLECDAATACPGARLDLDVIRDRRTIVVPGTVVWRRDERVGVEFADLGAPHRLAIDDLLRLGRPERLEVRFARRVAIDLRRLFDDAAHVHLLVTGVGAGELAAPPVRVVLGGDVAAELAVEAEEAPAPELVVGVARRAAELVAHLATMTISAPLAGPIARRPGDRAHVLAYQTARGPVRFTLVVRQPN